MAITVRTNSIDADALEYAMTKVWPGVSKARAMLLSLHHIVQAHQDEALSYSNTDEDAE